ncbi:MAG: hypothetical protein LBM92_02285 [Opitutaceae bacterium]|nr:hypothetical protein [Opitutaceae bacterium]
MTTIAFKIDENEAREIRLAARLQKMTLSAYIRRALVEKDGGGRNRITGRPGRMILVPPKGVKLRQEDIDAALEETR